MVSPKRFEGHTPFEDLSKTTITNGDIINNVTGSTTSSMHHLPWIHENVPPGQQRRHQAEADAAGARLDVRDHDYLPRVVPHFLAWRRRYGAPFLYWFGAQPRVCLLDYDSVRQVLSNKSGHFLKNDAYPTILAMLGKGLILVEGADWVRHRRVVNPAFAMDKIKMMSATMAGCAERLITEWEELASSSGAGQVEVEFSEQFQDLTADVISHTAFGSSYKEVFHTQQQLLRIALATILNVQLPGFKYLPTKSNRLKRMLEKKIKTTLMGIIQPRLASGGSGGYGDDLLGLMLEACFTTEQGGKRDELTLTMDEIIHECKTSARPSSLQAMRPRLICLPGQCSCSLTLYIDNADDYGTPRDTETLWPCLGHAKKAHLRHKIGKPHQTERQRNRDTYSNSSSGQRGLGRYANEFDPSRFENGVRNAAKSPQALLSFSIGPRSCIGQNFAMLEAKLVMSMILKKFSLTLSSGYVHAPADFITLQPKYGLPIILRPLDV
ncbi:hypothetical protein BS78_01G343100 [Paspalum vaginatum]|nr:hypothetical protein BS78_01G343100 [Paspalum vaginatum]